MQQLDVFIRFLESETKKVEQVGCNFRMCNIEQKLVRRLNAVVPYDCLQGFFASPYFFNDENCGQHDDD